MNTLMMPVLAAVAISFSVPAMAQMDHSLHGSPAQTPAAKGADVAMGEGLVKKIDKSKGTITLAHGAMHGMPPMTMVYKVKDVTWLGKLQTGQKIRFATDPADGGMTVTRFEPVK